MAKLIRSESDIATGAKAMNNNNKNFSSDGTYFRCQIYDNKKIEQQFNSTISAIWL